MKLKIRALVDGKPESHTLLRHCPSIQCPECARFRTFRSLGWFRCGYCGSKFKRVQNAPK